MLILDLKEYYENNDNPKIFLTSVFSWRGSYDEVAFTPSLEGSKEESLKVINRALTAVFDGWKGGEYRYDGFTRVHFENEPRACGDMALFELFDKALSGREEE